eukprot:m.32759 g.32759  ORF g.32759 m.32759 type:complete len:63 (+) comp31690_c0_seq4:24-212(+)
MNHLEAGQVKRLIKQKSYACDEEGCEKSFTTASHLKVHPTIPSSNPNLTTGCGSGAQENPQR